MKEGDPKFDESQVVPEFNYARYAESLGLLGIRIEKPEDVIPALEKALKADRPVVIDALTDPEIITFTPQVAAQKAEKLAEAIQQGDIEAGKKLEEPLKAAVEKAVKKSEEK